MASNQISDLDADVLVVKDCSSMLGRVLNHPRVYGRIVKASGATLDKVSEIVLNQVRDGGEARLSDIAAKLGVELSSVSRKVHKLENDGLVERKADPEDARASRLSLTQHGEDELTKMHEARCALVREILQDWPADERHRFATLFQRFHDDVLIKQETQQ